MSSIAVSNERLIEAALREAQAQIAAKQFDAGEAILRDVLRLDGNCHAALDLLARLALQSGRPDVAEQMSARARALRPAEVTYLATLGRVRRAQGRHADAVAVFRKALRRETGSAGFRAQLLVLLGLSLKALDRHAEAIVAYRKALTLRPSYAEAGLNLANALRESGELEAAAALYRKVAAEHPDYAPAQSALAAQLLVEDRKDDSLPQYLRALELDPRQPDLQFVAGWLMGEQGRTTEAIAAYERAVEQRPDFADAWVNLGLSLREAGQRQSALDCFLRAINIDPQHLEAHANFGAVLADFGLTAQGLEVLERAARIQPDNANVLSNLGAALIQNARAEEAVVHLRNAVRLAPDEGRFLANLGLALRGPGVQAESLQCLRRSVELSPDNDYAHSNLLLSLCYADFVSAADIVAAARNFGSRPFARPSGAHVHATAAPMPPQRRLRVGYVSPDLRTHSVAYFVEPVLEAHDRDRFEVFCYYSYASADAVTERIKGKVEHWRDCFGVPDAALARTVMDDGIDILIDLSGHTAHHRLPLFALRPAPVQATWLGYPTTVGLPAIDYRISDWVVDPQGSEAHSTEDVLRLPGSYFCYRPGPAPEVGPLPCASNGYLTFGSFNALAKLSDATVALWARVLHQHPGSHLLVKTKGLAELQASERVRAAFETHGIDRRRLHLVGWESSSESHLATYHRVDIALDSAPYNGATTTCEALWMGVPVVSLCGETHASRMGRSILQAAGLPTLVAQSEDEFLRIVAGLTADLAELAALRASLRSRLSESALLDAERYTRAFEALLSAAWARWAGALPDPA